MTSPIKVVAGAFYTALSSLRMTTRVEDGRLATVKPQEANTVSTPTIGSRDILALRAKGNPSIALAPF